MEVLLILAIVLVLSLIPLIYLVARNYNRFRGTRLMFCPIAKRVAQVRLDAGHAAWTSVVGETEVRVASCSEETNRQDCADRCLALAKV